jgi:integrase
VSKLTVDHVQDLLNILAETHAAKTVRNLRAVLRKALKDALTRRYLNYNPASLAELPQAQPSKYTKQSLTISQSRTLLEAVSEHRWAVIYRIALTLGLRRGEILGLLWQDIDFDHAVLKVTGALQRYDGALHRGKTKTLASEAALPIPTSLLAALRKHRDRQAEEGFTSEYCVHDRQRHAGRSTQPNSPLQVCAEDRRATPDAQVPRFASN